MADTYVQTCFAFACSAQEWSLLQEAFLLSLDLGCGDDEDAEPRSDAFKALFPPDDSDRWSGFRSLFDDPDHPDFGADLAGGADHDGDGWHAIVSAEAGLDPGAVARLIQRCCQGSLSAGPIGFQWSITCSRQRIDEFGGGWAAVFADRIEIETTNAALTAALADDAAFPQA